MALRATKFGMKVALEQPLSVMQITSPTRLSTERIYEHTQHSKATAVRHAFGLRGRSKIRSLTGRGSVTAVLFAPQKRVTNPGGTRPRSGAGNRV